MDATELGLLSVENPGRMLPAIAMDVGEEEEFAVENGRLVNLLFFSRKVLMMLPCFCWLARKESNSAYAAGFLPSGSASNVALSSMDRRASVAWISLGVGVGMEVSILDCERKKREDEGAADLASEALF